MWKKPCIFYLDAEATIYVEHIGVDNSQFFPITLPQVSENEASRKRCFIDALFFAQK